MLFCGLPIQCPSSGKFRYFRRHFHFLQGGEHLHPLADRYAIIEVTVNHECGRLEVFHERGRRPARVDLRLVPGRAAELRFREP